MPKDQNQFALLIEKKNQRACYSRSFTLLFYLRGCVWGYVQNEFNICCTQVPRLWLQG